jgi:hypothetical protein
VTPDLHIFGEYMRALLWIGLAVMLLVPEPSALAAERVLLADPQEARQAPAPLGALREAAKSNGSSIVGLACVPARWNHLVEKNSRKINGLIMILSQKWFPLLRIML